MATPKTWDNLDAIKNDMPEVSVVPIILQASIDTHRARIEERGRTNKAHLNLGGDRLEDVMFKYDFIKSLERPDIVRVDANGQQQEVYEAVKDIIEKHTA